MQMRSFHFSLQSLVPSSAGFTYKSLCLDNKLQISDSLGMPQRQGEEEKGGNEKLKERMRECAKVSQEQKSSQYANHPQHHKWFSTKWTNEDIKKREKKKNQSSPLFLSLSSTLRKKKNHLYSNHYALSLQLPHRLHTLSHQHQLTNIREQTAAYTEGAYVNVHIPVVSQVSQTSQLLLQYIHLKVRYVRNTNFGKTTTLLLANSQLIASECTGVQQKAIWVFTRAQPIQVFKTDTDAY